MASWGIIAHGRTAFITLHGRDRVLKGYAVYWEEKEVAYKEDAEYCDASLRQEAGIYQILKPHSHVLAFYGTVRIAPGIDALCLEFAAQGDLRQMILGREAGPALRQRLQWAFDLTDALQHLHAHGIVHGDISCRNLLIDSDNQIKLADFGGSHMHGQTTTVAPEARYQLPRRGREFHELPAVKEDLFALGSAIYEIVAWKAPFPELDEDSIERLFEANEFPDLDDINCGNVIRRLWFEDFNAADEVLADLKAQQH